ncbi:hypothetical protein HK103_000629 [Boothiomyces macroporosus]|uniref:Uncharacterized protein n=1 Tax=Boothiomyces macroporosus TaxID=261099 RepID=A0AAD5UL43_9FUNG|nr:hypothetical protein HK103_000629 [Boothiomyces macroporosus]
MPITPHKERICRQLKACVGFDRAKLRRLWEQILDTTGGNEAQLNSINIEEFAQSKSISQRKPKKIEEHHSSSEEEILPTKARRFKPATGINPRNPNDDVVRKSYYQYLSSFENILSHGYRLEAKISDKWVEADRWGIMATDTNQVHEYPQNSLNQLLRAAELAYSNIL